MYKQSYSCLALQCLNLTSNTDDTIIQLNTPVTISSRKSSKFDLSHLSPIKTEIPLSLATKPISKIDKRLKKTEKNEDQDSEWAISKLKSKKKNRSKVSFEEDFEPVIELPEGPSNHKEMSLLSLQRPTKIINSILPPVLVKQKVDQKRKLKPSTTIDKKDLKISIPKKPTKIILDQPLTVQELSEISFIPKTEIIKSLFLKGNLVTTNQLLDIETIKIVCQEFEIEASTYVPDEQIITMPFLPNKKPLVNLKPRPPIITVVGHVDHGKTTLLDKIRKTQLAQKEAGGITQKIGAYEVAINYKDTTKHLVFLDTPGHEAFSGMRSRGISITDIVVLVVSADDGIKPQTIEIIDYTKSKNIPIVVAINKIDKEESNVELVKKELSNYGLVSEDWGGDTVVIPISATQGTNIDILLEMIILVSEMLNLQANLDYPSEGVILESNLDKTRGAIASAIIQNGILRVGDTLVVSNMMAKIRGITNYLGVSLKEAYPSSPVTLWGLPKVPSISDHFFSFKNERDAKEFLKATENTSKIDARSKLNDSRRAINFNSKDQVNIIIKTDTQGSAEAITNSLSSVNFKLSLKLLNCSPGEVTETDVDFAIATKAKLISFNTSCVSGVKRICKSNDILLKEFDIIYDLLDYIESLAKDPLQSEYQEIRVGSAIVKTVFPLAKSFLAGTSVMDGKVQKSSLLHIKRNSQIIYKGAITSLKKLKEDVAEVVQGEECGIFIKDFDSWAEFDIIEAFTLVKKI
uniref:translation initiation factor 2 n=1 Tax=Cryptomonas gyropyrenoidosa TaxID=233257 RepID=UPI00279F2486|nr:translation initiation factor 2 [Cryptomonas gyropyrenoidosa]WFQ82976.1 translation initiation factor 2 [Cryptomonas gyropyrenoidosa]